jgi:hypothetical protein
MKKVLLASAMIVSATMGFATITYAQSSRIDRPGYTHGVRTHEFNRGPAASDIHRGGPGPRVQGGSGAGAGAER